ncbi:MAG: HEAT repeat domain-containing protein, partial [Actinomycetota bacterium]
PVAGRGGRFPCAFVRPRPERAPRAEARRWRAMGTAGRGSMDGRAELLEVARRLEALAADRANATPVRLRALNALGALGNKAVTGIAGILRDDPDPAIRQEAASCLGLCGGRAALRPLVSAMTADRDRRVRSAATWALGFLGDERAVPRLVEVLVDPTESGTVRGSAAEAIGHLAAAPALPETVAGLLVAAGDPDVEVRFWAVFALGCVAGDDVVADLERIARSDRALLEGWWEVGREAKDAVRSIKDRHPAG